MRYTKDELQRKFFSRDLSGLNLASLVRLSFEPNLEKKRQRPSILLSGADINGREDQDNRVKRAIESYGAQHVFTYDEPDTSAWKRRKVHVVTDGVETVEWRVKRPVYDGALEDLKRGVAPNGKALDGLIVYDLDRLTRDQVHLDNAMSVVKHYAKLISDMNLTIDLFTDIGRSNATFLVTAKAMQSTDTSRRVTDRHETIAKLGIPVGGSRPFGWNEDKRTLNLVESELLRKARHDLLFSSGSIGINTICREWRLAGIKTPKGKDFVPQVLRNVLLSPRLAGYRVYREDICYDRDGQPVMGQYEAIFTIEEWEDIRTLLTREGRASGDVHIGGRKRLLSGVVKCGLCGTVCRSYADKRLNTYYYGCPPYSKGGCGRVTINGVKLEGLIVDMVLAHLATCEVETEIVPWPHVDQLASKESKIKELMNAYQSDQLPGEQVFPTVAKLNKDVKALKRDRMEWNQRQQRANNTTSSVLDLWPHLSTDRKRTVIESVIQTIAINRRTIKQARFDPDRIHVIWQELSAAEISKKLSSLLSTQQASLVLAA